MTPSEIKKRVLQRVSGGGNFIALGKANYRIEDSIVHVRWRSDAKNAAIFSFNINPNTLRANFEVWICGAEDTYYLFPTEIMRQIYEDTDAYEDNRHPEIRVAEVDTGNHRLLFGRHSKSLDARQYFRCSLKGS